MSVQLNPYLHFRGDAREAMEFYRSVFGGELRINTYKEYGASSDPAEDDHVMHSQLDGDHGVVFMGSDTPSAMEYTPGRASSMSLSGDDEDVLRGWFDKLAGRHRDRAAGEVAVGGRLRHGRRPVRGHLDGQRRPGLTRPEA